MLWLLVAVRILSNPVANVLQKLLAERGASPRFVILASHALLSCACLPFVFFAWPASQEFWWAMALSALLAVFGNALLVEALKRTELSVVGPINAYKPVVSLLPALFFLGEYPGKWALAGIALIVIGSYFVTTPSGTPIGPVAFGRFFKDSGVQLRLGALILSAVEAVFLKRALLASSAHATFVFWSVLGFGVAWLWSASLRKPMLPEVLRTTANRSKYVLLALMTGIMQLSTLLVMEHLQVGSALALFQTSALLSVFFGHTVFREQHLIKRLLGAAIMVSGACLIIIMR